MMGNLLYIPAYMLVTLWAGVVDPLGWQWGTLGYLKVCYVVYVRFGYPR